MNINFKKTSAYSQSYQYNPLKHNAYFLRAQKMLYMFLTRRNFKSLKNLNPQHVDIFYKVFSEEIVENDRCRADITPALYLIQFFLMTDPGASVRNITRYHVIFELFGNIDIGLAKETLVGLLTPADNLFKISDKERQPLIDYMEACNFPQVLLNNLLQFKVTNINQERIRASKDEKIKNIIKNIMKNKGESKFRNVLLSYFHSLFNWKQQKKTTKQPEEVYTNILDIDRLVEYTQENEKQEVKTRSKLSRNSTIGNLSTYLDCLDIDDSVIHKQGFLNDNIYSAQKINIETSKAQYEEGSANPYLEKQNEIIDEKEEEEKEKKPKPLRWQKYFRRIVRFIMCANLFLNRPQMVSRIKNEKWDQNVVPYPENIRVTHPDLKPIMSDSKATFETCMRREHRAVKIMKIIESVMMGYYQKKTHGEFLKATRQPTTTSNWVPQLFFNSDRLFFELLKQFIVKITFHLENKTLFQSGYISGKVVILLCQNL